MRNRLSVLIGFTAAIGVFGWLEPWLWTDAFGAGGPSVPRGRGYLALFLTASIAPVWLVSAVFGCLGRYRWLRDSDRGSDETR